MAQALLPMQHTSPQQEPLLTRDHPALCISQLSNPEYSSFLPTGQLRLLANHLLSVTDLPTYSSVSHGDNAGYNKSVGHFKLACDKTQRFRRQYGKELEGLGMMRIVMDHPASVNDSCEFSS